jgi:guanylate cyclase soluble subunit alpha
LPNEYPKTRGETCYFLDGYKHPTVPESEPLEKHIEAAMEIIKFTE